MAVFYRREAERHAEDLGESDEGRFSAFLRGLGDLHDSIFHPILPDAELLFERPKGVACLLHRLS